MTVDGVAKMNQMWYNLNEYNHIKNSGYVVAHPLPFSTYVRGVDTMPDHTPTLQFIELSAGSKNIIDLRFGRLVALGPIARKKNRGVVWHCRCDCGNTKNVIARDLLSGNTSSCGCLKIDNGYASATHGLRRHPLYRSWLNMTQRCANPNNRSYADYGDRGINVCDEWIRDFKAFHDCVAALTHYGEPGYTLDRIDNNGNYEPGNVRFASRTEQARNRRSNRLIEYNGKVQSLKDWSEELQINYGTLYSRLSDYGWNVERAFTASRWGRK